MAIRSYARGSYRAARRFSLAIILALPLLSACGGSEPGSEAMSHIERADTYSAQGQYRSAMLEVRNALKAEPDNVAHVVALADLYLTIGAAREAADLLTPWLEQHAEAVALPLARAHVRLGKHLSARETLDAFTPQTPGQQQDAALIRAEAMRLAGDQAGALSAFRSQTESQPGDPEAVVGLARTQLDQNRPAEAVRTTRDWLERNGPAPEVQYWLATAQHRLDQLEQAAATLTDATGNLPASDVFLPLRREILTLLSRVLTEQGKMADAQVYNNILAENQNSDALAQGEAVVDALRNNDIEQAKSILADMLKADPDNQQAALMLGALNTGTGNLDEGSRLLEKNVDPETTPTAFLRAAAMAQIDTGKREEALQTLERALQARPNDNELLAMHGVLALSLPDHAQAGLQSLEKALEREPDRTRLRLAMAHYFIASGQPDKAIEPLVMVAQQTPNSLNALQQAARLYASSHSPAQTVEWLEALGAQHSNIEADSAFLAALVHTREGDFTKAKASADRLAGLAPQSLRALLLPAVIYQSQNQYDQALAAIDTAEENYGQTLPVVRARASVINSSEGPGSTYRYLLSQWQASGNDQLIPDLLAVAREHDQDSIGELTSLWLEKSPDSPAANMTRADWLLARNQGEQAIPHYEKVLQTLPENVAAMNNLAWLIQSKEPDRAKALSRRASENAPNNAAILDTYGWILHLSGEHAEAVTVLEKALTLAPGHSDIQQHLEAARQAL